MSESKRRSADATGGYSGTPLAKKLGIKAGFSVALLGAPRAFEAALAQLPEDVTLHHSARAKSDLTLWFTSSKRELERGIQRMLPRAEHSGLWIAWPKKASGVATDLSDMIVRETGLRAGIVDIKVCSIDATWSGLRFSVRKTKASKT